LKDRFTLDAACAGVQTVVSTASSTLSHQAGDTIETVDRDGELNLVEAAKAIGAQHFIFVRYQDQNSVACAETTHSGAMAPSLAEGERGRREGKSRFALKSARFRPQT
jgi:hypothetical protein